RTAIARALVRNAPIMIMDDSLSAVDTDTEEQILQQLRSLRKGKTNILIAHRISTVQHADHILVLDHGRCAEYGTHEELLEAHGIYRDLYDRQQLEKQLHQDGGDAE
ncbi:MAG: ABC transporter ATP-binding protein, partial [Clostridia bacterium]|nr:ABC transporter ATP-binding protein [Clostridia bacterium]